MTLQAADCPNLHLIIRTYNILQGKHRWTQPLKRLPQTVRSWHESVVKHKFRARDELFAPLFALFRDALRENCLHALGFLQIKNGIELIWSFDHTVDHLWDNHKQQSSLSSSDVFWGILLWTYIDHRRIIDNHRSFLFAYVTSMQYDAQTQTFLPCSASFHCRGFAGNALC